MPQKKTKRRTMLYKTVNTTASKETASPPQTCTYNNKLTTYNNIWSGFEESEWVYQQPTKPTARNILLTTHKHTKQVWIYLLTIRKIPIFSFKRY